MNQIARLLPRMTTDEFLDWPGDGSGRTFQLIDGAPCPVSPATDTHAMIQTNVASFLNAAFRAAGLQLRARTEAPVSPGPNPGSNVRVPDVVVAPGPTKRGGKLAPEPVLVAEVLSPSNVQDTRGNIRAYASIPSMQAMLVVHSDRALVEVCCRAADGTWPDPRRVGPKGRLQLPSIAGDCPVGNAYLDTWLLHPDE